MKRVGLVLGLVLVLGVALPSQSAWAWRSGRPNIVVISPRPFVVITPGPFCCCFSPFQSQPFVFHHGFIPHRRFIVPPVVSLTPVVPMEVPPFVGRPDPPGAVPGPQTWGPPRRQQEGEAGGENECERDACRASMGGGDAGATAGATTKGGVASTGQAADVFGSGPTGGLLTLRQPAFTGMRGSVAGGRGFRVTRFESESFLIVDVTPRDAEVFVDNRLLGVARQLVARALRLPPGQHVVTIAAQGFRSYVARFVADQNFPVRIHVALAPE